MLSVTPLSKPFAGEVKGIDLNDPISDELFSEILDAWTAHPVLVFRDQHLDVDTHQKFAARFGELTARVRPPEARGSGAQNNPYLMLVSNIRENGQFIGSQGDGTLGFHSDGAFNEIPTSASLLYGIEIPTTGGDTLFVNMNEVYESLDDATKAFIGDKWAINYHNYDRNGAESGIKAADRGKAVRHATHPMVIAHPVTGKPILFVNSLNSREIIGVDQSIAGKLLEGLFARIERPELIYAHKWRKGDLLIWDNRCLQHGRSDWEPRERRLLRRFAVKNKTRPQPYADTVKKTA